MRVVPLFVVPLFVPFVIVTAACGPAAEGEGEEGEEGEGEEGEGEGGEGEGEGEPSGLDVEVGPDDYPCDFPQAWPIALTSTVHNVTVHIRDEEERDIGEAMLSDIEASWNAELDLGFVGVPGDGGLCGDDDNFDAFLFRGSDVAYVDYVDVIPDTSFADVSPYMVLDWEVYPDSVPAHELNHAMQASCDWGETAFIYEATSQYIEDELFPDDDTWKEVWFDYQGQADRAVDYNDDYVGYYLYGAALYLQYLKQEVFTDNPQWIGQMWLAARSDELPDGTSADPDVEDVLEDMIQASRGMSFSDSVIEFAKWRYYMGSKADGVHGFDEGAEAAEDDRVPEVALDRALDVDVSEFGTVYLALANEDGGAGDVTVTVSGPNGSELGLDGGVLVGQALPGSGGADGDSIDGTTTFVVPMVGGARVLALTLLPPASRLDPDVVERPRRTLHLVPSP